MTEKHRLYRSSLNPERQALSPFRMQGMNRYMYVEGNPVKYNDPSGHKLTQTQSWAIMGYLAGPMVGIGSMEGAVLGIGLKSYEKQISKMLRRSDPGR